MIGWLALQLAFGDRAGSASTPGAIHELAQQPFGLACWSGWWRSGCSCWCVWRAARGGLLGHRDERRGSAGPQAARRRPARAVVYGVHLVRAAVAVGERIRGLVEQWHRLHDRQADGPARRSAPGRAVGVGIAGGRGRGGRQGVDRQVRRARSTRRARSGRSGTAYVWLGRVGYVAKGVAFGDRRWPVRATRRSPTRRTSPADSTRRCTEVLEQPFGPALLSAIALGIVCYGLFCFAGRATSIAERPALTDRSACAGWAHGEHPTKSMWW